MKENGLTTFFKEVREVAVAVFDNSPVGAAIQNRQYNRAVERGSELWKEVKEEEKSGKDKRTIEELNAAIDEEVLKLSKKH